MELPIKNYKIPSKNYLKNALSLRRAPTSKYNNQIYTYKSKLSEYKRKIILLKRRVDELYNKNTNETEHTSNNIYNKIRDRKHLRSQYNFLNKNKIQISTEKKELFDDMEKYSHHRYNTFINDYNNYFNNI